MIKLDYLTLSIVISIISLISTFAILLLKNMNTFEKGLNVWLLSMVLSSIGFFVMFFQPLLSNYAIFINNICSLTAPLLILEGVFQFREYPNNKLRRNMLPVCILIFIIASFVNMNTPINRYIFHDISVAILFILSAYFFNRKVNGNERLISRLIAFSLLMIALVFLYRFYLASSGLTDRIALIMPILFLSVIIWLLGWTIGIILLLNNRAQNRLVEVASIDELTGLKNRKYLYGKIDTLITQSKTEGDKYVVYLLDLNGFKNFNDSYGHSFGDEVLICMAKSIKSIIRESDFASRLGGDEFVVIIKMNKPDDNITQLESRLRLAIEKEHLINDLKVELKASIGHSIISNLGGTVDQIIEIADKSMYEQKIGERLMSTVK